MKSRDYEKKRKHGKALVATAVIAGVALLTACGKVRSARSLISEAKRNYGDCTVVSKTEASDKTQVILHDELQDFDYTITSSMDEIWIDGSSFGSLPGTSDNFYNSLLAKIQSNVGSDITDICNTYNAEYEWNTYFSGDLILTIRTGRESQAIACAEECAEILQEQNLQGRLDEALIAAEHIPDDADWYGERYGSVKLPDTRWRTREDENVDYYTEMAHLQTDPKAVYLRTEKGYFRDTGADLSRVVNTLGTDFPENTDDPVTFYYFRSSKGDEYFLCDFNYYKDGYSDFAYYTNYQK